jgi:hypothetical protein
MSGRLKSYYASDANVSDSTPFCGVTHHAEKVAWDVVCFSFSMPTQTYAALPVPPLNPSQNLNATEPDQVSGIPTSATEISKKDITIDMASLL